MNSEEILADVESLEKVIVYLYSHQTRDEQADESTHENNGVGFNMVDAPFLSSLAQWILAGKYMSNKQIDAARIRLGKYIRQYQNGEYKEVQLPRRLADSHEADKRNHKDCDGVLGLSSDRKGLVFTPYTYPSKQIKTIGFNSWENQQWHQGRPYISQQVVDDVLKLFPKARISPEVLKAVEPVKVELPEDIKNHDTLFPFQKETIEFALAHKQSMIALAPGLGKTATSIFAAKAAQCTRILVVSPLSLIYTWRNEIKKWTGENASTAYGSELLTTSRWTITNYDTLRLRPDKFLPVKWDAIIIDESICIKNRKAKRTQAVKELIRNTKPTYTWLLSGAPVAKLFDDMWSQLNVIQPSRFSSYWRFAERYCFVENDQWGWRIVANRPEAAEQLPKDLSDVYFARTQDQVLDLPEWIIDDVHIPMTKTQDKIYGQMEEEFLAELGDDNTVLAPNVLSQMVRLVQIASNPMLLDGNNDSAKWVALSEILEYEKLPAIVWTSFIKTASYLEQALGGKYRVAKLTGATPAEERQDIVDRFQNGELDVLIAHPGVGKFGLTLTAGRTAIYLERGYNGDDYYQSLHRIRRIGTKFSPHVIHMISDRFDGKSSTIDNVIGKILKSRRDNAIAITTGEVRKLFEENTNE